MKMLRNLVLVGVAIFLLLQLVRPRISSAPASAEILAPVQVRQILDKDCYSCHSDQRRLSWFDEVAPGYWLVQHDIVTAREHLNFSRIGAKPAAAQRATLFEAVNMIQLGAMPLPQFTALHPEAKVAPGELATLKSYLAPWTAAPPSAAAGVDATAPLVNLAAVAPEFNGLPFEPGFESWKIISMTDRGDNNTFRFILGNEIAVKAARAGKIQPWPDGARLAKVAWQQESGADGLVHPGKFVQVEFMVKDKGLYKQTAGWGWGRWRGMDLKPYGENSRFVGECTTCHLPVRGADDVYTLPITPVQASQQEVVNNEAAALPSGLPFQPFEWNAITLYVDRGSHTVSALFGNDEAARAVAGRRGGLKGAPDYPQGAVLALVTWNQRDDPHWFGARIPAMVRSVEFVQAGPEGAADSYRRFDGTGVQAEPMMAEAQAQRRSFVLGLAPAVLP